MAKNVQGKRNITTDQAIKILRDNGLEIDKEQAKIILDLLYLLAELEVNQYIKK